MEATVLSTDEKITAARLAMINARSKLTSLQRGFAQSITSDLKFAQAQATLVAAELSVQRTR